MKVVVLLSGGVDSVTALHQSVCEHEEVVALSFDYGARHNARELPFAEYQCRLLGVPHRIARFDFMEKLFRSDLLKGGGDIPEGPYNEDNMRQTVVPFRNGVFLAIAAGFAESVGAGGLVIAAHSGDHSLYPDCRESFMLPMAEAIRAGTDPGIEVLRPFIQEKKDTIIALGTKLGIDYAQTWSCYQGRDLHCGKCGTCIERRQSFALARVEDPTQYAD